MEDPPNDRRWQEDEGNTLISTDIPLLCSGHRGCLFEDRKLDKIFLGERWVRLTWTKAAEPGILRGNNHFISVGTCNDNSFIALVAHKTINDTYDTVVLNDQHPYSKWLLALEWAEGNGVGREQIAKATKDAQELTFNATAYRAVKQLQDFITKWNQIPNLSPHLEWQSAPAGTKSFAIVMDDPDAPTDFTHWLVYNIPPSVRELAEGASTQRSMPQGAAEGRNDFGRSGYGGPCPPRGNPHHYVFRVYALDLRLDLFAGATRKQVDAAMSGHVVAQGQAVGTYQRMTP
jgi:hypothetical protein